MSKNRLVLVRHGESMGNHWKHAYKDDRTNFLSDIGVRQAEIAGLLLKRKDFNFTYIVSSDLTRARQTTSTILINMGDWERHYEVDSNLNEFNQFAGEVLEEHTDRVYKGMENFMSNWIAGDAMCVTHHHTMERIFEYFKIPKDVITTYKGIRIPNAVPFIYDLNNPSNIIKLDQYHHIPQF